VAGLATVTDADASVYFILENQHVVFTALDQLQDARFRHLNDGIDLTFATVVCY
jgi:hypothetical protein